jgi:hypothetical protein
LAYSKVCHDKKYKTVEVRIARNTGTSDRRNSDIPTSTLFGLTTTRKDSLGSVRVTDVPHFRKEMETGAKYGDHMAIKLKRLLRKEDNIMTWLHQETSETLLAWQVVLALMTQRMFIFVQISYYDLLTQIMVHFKYEYFLEKRQKITLYALI